MAGAVAFSTWLIVNDANRPRSRVAPTTTSPATASTLPPKSGAFGPTLLTGAPLVAAAASLTQPLYWAGAEPAKRYELTRDESGKMIVRYLPADATAGDPEPRLTVATIPRANAYAESEGLAKQQGATSLASGGGGRAWYRTDLPGNRPDRLPERRLSGRDNRSVARASPPARHHRSDRPIGSPRPHGYPLEHD